MYSSRLVNRLCCLKAVCVPLLKFYVECCLTVLWKTDFSFFFLFFLLLFRNCRSKAWRPEKSGRTPPPSPLHPTLHTAPQNNSAGTHQHTNLRIRLPWPQNGINPDKSICLTHFVCLYRGWFSSTGSEVSLSSSNSSVDMGDAPAGGMGGAVERWSVFGPRPLVQKSTSDLGSDSTPAGKWHHLTVLPDFATKSYWTLVCCVWTKPQTPPFVWCPKQPHFN